MKNKTKSLKDIIVETTTNSASGGTLTLEMLEKAYKEASKIPQPTGIEFRWILAYGIKLEDLRKASQ